MRLELQPARRWTLRLLGALGVFLPACCDDSFSPLAPTTLELAVHGFLDVSADTQWIRVTPMRGVIATDPASIGVTARLRRISDGHEVELRDSVFRFAAADSTIGSAGVYVHNFWTADKIHVGSDYQLTVRRDDHAPSELPVAIPADYEVEVWLRQNNRTGDYFTFLGVKHVPFVTLTVHCFTGAVQYPLTAQRTGPEAHRVNVQRWLQSEVCRDWSLAVVGSEREWPSGVGYSLSRLTDGAGKYSNTLGFVGGVFTKVIPYENCELVGGAGNRPEYCTLRYNAATASLSGMVTEARCGGAIREAKIDLVELGLAPPAYAQMRSTESGGSGYRVSGLVPGVSYALKVWVDVDPWVAVYSVHTDTLVFQPGEQRSYDVKLERDGPCGSAPVLGAGGRP